MNFSHISPLEGEFFAFFTLWGWNFAFFTFPVWILFFFTLQGWIPCIFHPFRMNFLQFLTSKGEFIAFFSLLEWSFCIFYPSRVNSLQFLPEFFAVFTLQVWNLCNFYFFEIFLGEKDKKFLLQWWIFWTFGLYFSDWGFSFWNSACVLFCHKSPVFFWVICWCFLSFKRLFFTIFAFSWFCAMKMGKKCSFV